MKKTFFFAKAALIFVIIFFASSHVLAAENDAAGAAPRKTVRVGYFIGEGFQETSSIDGRHSGYCYEYLQTLSYYTGWQYEYVETSWAGALEKIASGEIDILAQVSKTEERQKYMLYADRPMGAEDYYLYVLPGKNSKLRSDDVSTLNGAKVGVNAGSYQLQTFIAWCEENDVQCEIVESEDEDYRIDCFFNGELDAIVDNDFYLDQGWLPLYKTGTSDYYMCVTMSRKDIFDDLNAAQEKLFENSPLYIQKLQTTYFPHDNIPKGLNQRESEWLANRLKTEDKIKLGYTDDYLPYCSLNQETGQLEGGITIFIESLKEHFGIEVEALPYDSQEALYEAVRGNEIDACFPLYDMLWHSENLGIMQTDAFIEFPVAYIFRKNEYRGSHSGEKFAVARISQMQSAYIQDKHPGEKIVVYDDYKDCLSAISKGEVDGMYINSFVLSRYYELYQEYANLDVVYVTENANLCLGVSDAACPELLTIFNKNILLIDDALKTSYLVRNTKTEEKYFVDRFVKTHALGILVIVLAVSALIISLFWYQLKRVRMAQQHEKDAREAAYEAFEAANRANDSKTRFLSSMSHDIRTPMNAIVGMTAIATANLENSEKVRHCLSEITTSSKHLLELINEVLDMNKIESGKLSLAEAEFDLCGMIDEFISVVKPLIEERNHTFLLDTQGIKHKNVIGDAERIHQCLVNFVSNSVKYTPNGGEIRLTVSEKETDRPTVSCYEFTIEDNGIGMSEEFVKVMFDPFTRADGKHVESQQGTGLGMSITRNIIKMMNGDIKVQSRLNEGTKITFTVFLAVRETDEDPSVSAADKQMGDLQKFREEDFRDINVLLVEDNGINAEIATEILKMTGVNVEHVWNGREAVEKLSSADDGYYRLVLMDIQMPIMDGYAATQEIRASEREYLQNVPIIAMSANAFAEDVAKSKAIGMNDHIAKPINFDRLLMILREYISDAPKTT